MKIYAVAVERFTVRYQYIVDHIKSVSDCHLDVVGVDGYKIDSERYSSFLSPGQIGCALSHAKACNLIASGGDKCGLIVEDDVVLPKNIDSILSELEKVINDDEIIFLYNRNIISAKYSSCGQSYFDQTHKLIYPLSMKDVRTAAAYVVGRKAAKKISSYNHDAKTVADDWHQLYLNGYFSKPRLLYPNLVSMKGFSSTIGCSESDSVIVRLGKRILSGRLFQIVRMLRLRAILRSKENNHTFVSEKSVLNMSEY